jgi:DNA-binding MarR family transcriptional regulator
MTGTGITDRLVERQLVLTNRRQIALTLTARGQATFEKVRNEIRLRLAGLLKNLPATGQKTVQRAIRVLHRLFDDHATAGNPSPRVKL